MYCALILTLRTTGSGWNDAPNYTPSLFERVELAGLLFALLSLLVSVVTSLVALVSIVASIASRNGAPTIPRLLHLLLWPRVALLCGLLIHYGAILYASYADATVMTFAEPELQMSLPLSFAILLVLDIGSHTGGC
jgi:hypothetical protein